MKRWMRFLVAFCAAALLQAGSASAANVIGASVKNAPAGGVFGLGDLIEVELNFSFDEGVKSFGGGVDVAFDASQLELVSFAFDARFPFNPAQPDASFNRPLGFFNTNGNLLAFGDFNPFGDSGIIAVLMFKALQQGDGSVRPTGQNLFPAGPIIGEDGGELPVSFAGGAYSIVPEPGTVLLLSAGLVGLAAVKRRRA